MKMILSFACLLTSSVWGRSLEPSRSVFKSGRDLGNVNLVEFSAKGIIYGRCSYTNPQGERITVEFEEKEREIRARSDMKEVTDPVEETNLCRAAAAATPPVPDLDSRSETAEANQVKESEVDLGNRMASFLGDIMEDQRYVSSLSPRFIRIVPLDPSTSSSAGLFSSFFNKFSQITLGTVEVPLPVLNVPVGIQNIDIPLIVPSIQTVSIPKPVIGK